MKLQFPSGSDVALVRIEGNPKKPEPSHVRICFPGGSVEVVRATDGENADYWAHVHIDRPTSNNYIPGEQALAKIMDSRIDSHLTGTGQSWIETDLFKDPGIYHVAFRVKREA